MLIHERRYVYKPEELASTVWGFIHKKTSTIHRPINAKKVGEKVLKSDYDSMTEYSAMQKPVIQYSNTLEAILYAE
jgi:methyltransferase-like protein